MSEDKNEVVKDDEEAVKEKKPVKKKKEDKDESEVNNTIELEPTLKEAEGKTVVFNFGRMNPVTVGHEKLANKMKEVAKKAKADAKLYLTHSNDPKKNPLSHKDKVKFAKKAFGNIVVDSPANTIIKVMQDLDDTYQNAILVVGADRIADFKKLLNQYNGKEYNFDSIQVVSAGDRDPDAEGVEGMSASKMRAMAQEGKFDEFVKGVPSKLKSQAKAMYDAVRRGMKLAEEIEELIAAGLLDEALTFAQKQALRRAMRRNKAKILAGRKRALRKKPTQEKIEKRAEKRARNLIRAKIIGKGKKSYDQMTFGERSVIDAKVAKKKALIKRIAKRLIPIIRREAMSSAAQVKEDLDMSFEALFEVRQDQDIRDKEGTQPAKYYSGLAKSTKDKRDAHFKKGAKMDDNNPAAYKPAPGDAEAKTKESEHTKKYKAMYGEMNEWVCGQCNCEPCVCEGDIHEASQNDEKPKKRYHEARKKDGTIKLDGRFRAFKKKPKPLEENSPEQRLKDQHRKEREDMSREHESEMNKLKARNMRRQIRDLRKEEFEDDKDLLALIEEVANDISESLLLDEEKAMDGLKKKAEKSGISYGILKKVYDRGVAAWRTGHRPGTTPQQWGYARVNSFITGGKTRTTADADLWKQHNESVEEATNIRNLKLINKIKKSGVVKKGSMSKNEELDEAFEALNEKLKVSDGAGAWVKDFYKSDAPQFKGKSKEERQKMAIAAYLDAKGEQEEAVSPAQQAAIAIAKKKKAGKPGYNDEGKSLKEFFDLDEQFELSEASILDKALAAIHKHVMGGSTIGDIAWQVSRAQGVNMSGRQLEKEYLKKYGNPKKQMSLKDLDKGIKDFRLKFKVEEHGAGDEGTDKLTKKYKKDTPGQMDEAFEGILNEAQCDLVGIKQIKEFEKFVDRMFQKFGIDFNFTRHFADRMSDDRNDPCITMKELAQFITKIYKNQGKSLKGVSGAEAVIKDLQTDLNIPVAVEYDARNDEFDVVMKTIMRKKNFKTPNKVIKY